MVLKDIIGKKNISSNCDTLIIGKNTTSDKQNIVDGFSSYFVNVGPDLANKIEADTSATSYIDKRNTSSIFITPTSDDEIWKIFFKTLRL